MRLRDAPIGAVQLRACVNLFLFCRARISSRRRWISPVFQAVVLRELQHVISEVSLLKQRRQLIMRPSFNLGAIDDSECLRRFRLTSRDIGNLVRIIDWPETMLRTKRRGYVVDPVLGICVLLRRLRTVSGWRDLEEEFASMMPLLTRYFMRHLISSTSDLVVSYVYFQITLLHHAQDYIQDP
jgi:hypothetical protein